MTLALSIILVLSSVLMIILVLLHKGKGSGLSDLFGGGVSSTYGGSSVVEKNLDRITIVVGGVWFAADETKPSFAEDGTVEVPAEWDCPRCGFPAGQDKNKPPMPMKNEPYKTHLAYVKERRTEAEANKVLDIALKKLRGDD